MHFLQPRQERRQCPKQETAMKITPGSILSSNIPVVYILSFVSIMAYFSFSAPTLGFDDAFYSSVDDIFALCKERYFNWSSRVIIDGLTMLFCKYSIGAFKIINVFVLLSIPFSIYSICRKYISKELFWAVFLVVLTYNLKEMLSAGLVATALNYSWPCACMLIVFAACVKMYDENISLRTGTLAVICALTVFATNQEQVCLITLIVAGAFNCLYYYKHKSIHKQLALLLFICGLGLLSILFAPGNASRLASEITGKAPDFLTFSFVYKAYLGFITTTQRYFFNITLPYISFSILLGLVLYERFKESLKPAQLVYIAIPALFPMLFVLIRSYFRIDSHYIYLLDGANFSDFRLYFFLAASLFMVSVILFMIYLAFKDTGCLYQVIFILAVGCISRMVMGFSPTLFASWTRTFIFMDFSFIIASVILIGAAKELSKKHLFSILFPCALLQTINIGIHTGTIP